MSLLPQISNELNASITTEVKLPSKTYKLMKDVTTTEMVNGKFKVNQYDRILGYVDDLEAVKQAVYHILNTERYSCLIYDDNYGVELEQYIGKDLSFIKATIETTLSEALTYDLRITQVTVNSINKISSNEVLINFTVFSIYGDLIMEVSIDV